MGKGGGGGGGDNRPFPANIGDARSLIAEQEAALNRTLQNTANLNLFDVVTPFGSRTFTGTPGQPGFQQTETLPFAAQRLLGNTRRFGREQFETALKPLFGQVIGGGDELGASAGALEQATFERGRNLLQPGFDRDRQRLENNLIQRGIPRGSEAWNTEVDDLERRQGAQLENLALSSVGAGRDEQSRQIQADIARRQQMATELGLFGFGNLAQQQPQFQPVPTLGGQAPDVLGSFGLLSANQQAEQARRAQQEQSALGGLFNIGAGLIGLF